jgi:hypothetical protein
MHILQIESWNFLVSGIKLLWWRHNFFDYFCQVFPIYFLRTKMFFEIPAQIWGRATKMTKERVRSHLRSCRCGCEEKWEIVRSSAILYAASISFLSPL